MKDILNTYRVSSIIAGREEEVCGVKDYGYFLAHKYNLSTLKFEEIGLSTMRRESILLLYPVQSYAYSLKPLFIMLLLRFTGNSVVLNLHEYSQKKYLARLFIKCLVVVSNHTVFTNDYERHKFRKMRSSVYPIVSNVFNEGTVSEVKYDLVYFGQIRPGKGIERFIKEVKALEKEYSVAIIGAVNKKFLVYLEGLKELIGDSNIKLELNNELGEVSKLLNGATCAYLPFPDGASSRRGTLLACLDHDMAVLTTQGLLSDEFFSEVTFVEEKPLKLFLSENIH